MKDTDAFKSRRRRTPHKSQQANNEQHNDNVNLSSPAIHLGNHSSNANQQHNISDFDDDKHKGRRRNNNVLRDLFAFVGRRPLGKNPFYLLPHASIFCHKHETGENDKSGTFLGIGRKKLLILYSLWKLFSVLVLAVLSTSVPKLLNLQHWFESSLSSVPSAAFLGRPLTDEFLDEMPMKIAWLDFVERGHDLGGWKHPRHFFRPPALNISENVNHTRPDFGGLNVIKTMPKPNGIGALPKDQIFLHNYRHKHHHRNNRTVAVAVSPQRVINPDDDKLAYQYWKKTSALGYHRIHSYHRYPEDYQDEKHRCHAPNWVMKYRPLCNSMHELGLVVLDDKKYVSHGGFRDVWLVDHHHKLPYDPFFAESTTQSALKMSRWKHSYDHGTFVKVLNDALVMERLTMSPRIVDAYGHCGFSVWVEPLPHEVEEFIVPGKGRIKQDDLHDEHELKPQNHYTIEEKLDIALFMAESLADLHGFRDGVIVHDDVQLAQWLRTPDGRLKFGDFNRATILSFDSKHNEYCRYDWGGRPWRYRAPEEYAADYNRTGWMNEQIDTYSFGNGIYALLTGLWPFYDVSDDEVIAMKVVNGSRSFIDPRWKEQGYIENKLVSLLKKCWRAHADDRIDIFEAVRRLREIKKEHERQKRRNATKVK